MMNDVSHENKGLLDTVVQKIQKKMFENNNGEGTRMSEELGDLSVRPHPQLDGQYRYLRVFVGHGPISPSISLVALNKPDKHNAICKTMWFEIGHVFQQFHSLKECRVIVLIGLGPTFCAGIDLTDPSFLPPRGSDKLPDVLSKAAVLKANIRAMQDCFTALETCPVPVISVIHGPCLGAGVDLICCTDVRMACTTTAQFAIREIAFGFAADVGTLQRLPKLMGHHSTLHELCYTGRNFSAQEAQEIGLLSKQYCAPTRKELMRIAVKRLASTIAQQSPVAIQNIKSSLLYSRDHSVQDGLEQIASINAIALQGIDFAKMWKGRKSADDQTEKNAQKIQSTTRRAPPTSKL
jgi:Delta3,5-Delta2,4-dienoyl-CoA isomerase